MSTNYELGLCLQQKEIADLIGITPQAVSKILRENRIETLAHGHRLQLIEPASFRKILSIKNLKVFKGVIGVHIVKGGVGKTTLVHGLASRAVALGHKILMVDLDQQGNLSHSFGIWPELGKDPTLLNVYDGHLNGVKVGIENTIVEITDDLHIVPANLSLANLDSALLIGTDNLARLFSDLFAPVMSKYDVIFIDCPPALSKVTAAVHCFVDHIVMPVNADAFSLEGLQLTIEHLSNIKNKFGAKPTFNIVMNKFVSQHKMSFEVLKALTDSYGENLCETFISSTKKIENSLAAGECIWKSKNNNNALDDMHNFLVELMHLDTWKDQWKNQKSERNTNKLPIKSNVKSNREVSL